MKAIFPKPLKKGDKIAIISPAGSVDASQVERGIKLIVQNGYEPVLSKNVFGLYENAYHYSGMENERLEDINWALNNPEVSAIWATRGGYGCQHLLQDIDMSGFIKNPKWYIGYSDNTAIQSLLLKNGFASIHGQTLKTASFGVEEKAYTSIFNILEGKKTIYTLPKNVLNPSFMSITGQLVGGNLSLIYALLGTPFSFDFRDKILFIEDIGEHFYALDRMLMSLDLAGVFCKIKGLIIGGMTNMGEKDTNSEYENSFDIMAYKIVSDRVNKYNFPVFYSFPNGHIFENYPIVIGGEIRINIENDTEKYEF